MQQGSPIRKMQIATRKRFLDTTLILCLVNIFAQLPGMLDIKCQQLLTLRNTGRNVIFLHLQTIP